MAYQWSLEPPETRGGRRGLAAPLEVPASPRPWVSSEWSRVLTSTSISVAGSHRCLFVLRFLTGVPTNQALLASDQSPGRPNPDLEIKTPSVCCRWSASPSASAHPAGGPEISIREPSHQEYYWPTSQTPLHEAHHRQLIRLQWLPLVQGTNRACPKQPQPLTQSTNDILHPEPHQQVQGSSLSVASGDNSIAENSG